MQNEEKLRAELDLCAAGGMTPAFWLRDDDAVSDSAALRRLFRIARNNRMIVALAVIPERADHSLAEVISTADCCVWQHGWGHHAYAYGEFGDERPLNLMTTDAMWGQRRLDLLFGPTGWQRVFVPPFHELSVPFKMLLPRLGYLGLSAGPLTPPIDAFPEVNVEVDLMNWETSKFAGNSDVYALVVEKLKLRRTGKISNCRPIGLLTHHLAFDEEAWNCLEELLRLLRSHRAVEILDADKLFAGLAPAARNGKEHADKVTVVVSSCDRQDLLARTLDSFFKYNTYPVHEFIVIEDGSAEKNRALEEKYRDFPFRWVSTGSRVGQIAAVDVAYGLVRTEFIFHCEDDWEFIGPGFIEKSLTILKRRPEVLLVSLRALNDTNDCPVSNFLLLAEQIPYRLMYPPADLGEGGIWYGFSFNPGLRRRRDYRSIGSFGSLDRAKTLSGWQCERAASEFYIRRGFVTAILADNGGDGYVRHLGSNRHIGEFARDKELQGLLKADTVT